MDSRHTQCIILCSFFLGAFSHELHAEISKKLGFSKPMDLAIIMVSGPERYVNVCLCHIGNYANESSIKGLHDAVFTYTQIILQHLLVSVYIEWYGGKQQKNA